MNYNFTTYTNKLYTFNNYNSKIHPKISQKFQTTTIQFNHTLITPNL